MSGGSLTRVDGVCPVCGGTQKITMKVRLPVDVHSSAVPLGAQAGRKTYPCPECSGVVHEGSVVVRHAYSDVDERTFVLTPEVVVARAVTGQNVDLIVKSLLRDGLLDTTEVEGAPLHMRRFVTTLGVVHPSAVKTIEGRLANRQDAVARDAIDEVSRRISRWARGTGHSNVPGEVVQEIIEEALASVLDQWRDARRIDLARAEYGGGL